MRVAYLLPFVFCGAAQTAGSQQTVPTPTQPTPTPISVSAPLVAPDSSPLFERPNGALVRAATYVYQLSLLRADQSTPLGTRTVQVTDAQAGGVPNWLIAETRTGTPVPTSDSLWVARADLTPTRWIATIDRSQLGASFTHDSLFGGLQTYQGRSSFSSAIPPGALITPGMVDQIVMLLPLRVGYRASASLLLIEQGAARALPAEIMVVREERMRVGTGEVDCWLVALRAGVMEERLWVAKDSPRVVRTEQTSTGGVLVGELRQ